MAYKFAFARPDGGVSIVDAAPQEELERVVGVPTLADGKLKRVLTDEQYRALVLSRMRETRTLPSDAVVVELPADWTPPDDRGFREAWKLQAESIEVDMPKARTIHMDRIRVRRNQMLDDLDKEWNRATGQRKQAEADAIEAQRQTLRDLPQTFDLNTAATPDELKAVWPDELR
jgi:hypothetical protein